MTAEIRKTRKLKELLREPVSEPAEWGVEAVVHDECLGYLVWNKKTSEALIIDAMREGAEEWMKRLASHAELRFLAVVDTHTHADHISHGAELAELLGAPFVMHFQSATKKVHFRVSRDTTLPALAGSVRFIETPGHTPDSITVLWGPFLFTGDTILYGDTGRDDLPGGDPQAHYRSLRKIEAMARPETLVLPGHDCDGGKVVSWKKQLEINPSLTQKEADFVREATAYSGPSPEKLKESLFENLK